MKAVLPGTKVSKVASKSASSKIIAGDFPPSSNVVRARRSAVCLTTSIPTEVPPVSETISIEGCETRCCVTFVSAANRVKTPEGNSASSIASEIILEVNCDSGACLPITVQPANKAGITFIPINTIGPLNVIIDKTVPIGSLNNKASSLCSSHFIFVADLSI